LDVALGAWRRAESGGVPISLVVVGSEKLPTEIGLFQAGSLTDDEWAALLAGAEAFCYPTRYEGFGMPALESAASGTPVVCARVGPLPEVLGQAAEWCASPTVTEVAAGLSRVLGDDARRSALRIAGLARAADAPTWADSAEAVLSAYRMAAG
jgi:glycosyltransferase involved in cell wall biosynthesis